MLTLSNTEHLTGVRISGDYWDFKELNHSIEKLLLAFPPQEDGLNSTRGRLLGMTDYLSKTKHGEGNIETTFNGINGTIRTLFDEDFPFQNIYFSTEILWPESIFLLISLNHFLNLVEDSSLYPPPHILTLKKLQSSIFNCLNTVVQDEDQQTIKSLFANIKPNLCNFIVQYIDLLNVKFLAIPPDLRPKQLTLIVQKLHDADVEYTLFKKELSTLAKRSHSSVHTIPFQFDYPKNIVW